MACVPWRLDTPHETWGGASTVLKAVVKTDLAGHVQLELRRRHTPATGSIAAGTHYGFRGDARVHRPRWHAFFATLTVTNATGTTSDQYKILMKDFSLQVQTNVAIDKGLWYFHKIMTRQTSQRPAHGLLDGIRVCQSLDGAAVLAFENEGHRPDGDATKIPYVETVQRGLNYLFYHMYSRDHRQRDLPRSRRTGTRTRTTTERQSPSMAAARSTRSGR